MRAILDIRNPAKVVGYQPFLSGGVPGDKGMVGGPDPPIQPNTAYKGAWPASWVSAACKRSS